MDSELVGTTLADRYLIEERIGAGGMGEVYRARHVKFGKLFAVKVLHSRLLADPKVRKRFDREAELAGTLKHPNIVGVVDVGETAGGVRYMVMELAMGEPLSVVIATGPLPAPRAIAILRQLCDALHHAHDRGLVHRDFKPDNVIVERRPDGTDFVRIIDFGIAILRDDLSSSDTRRLTTSGVVLGTPQYLAPEQAFGSGDHRIDLFALGVISYELLTGRLPFDGEGAEIARANLTMTTPPMGLRVPYLDVDPLLEAFTLQLMSKSPELRPETGKEARDMLDLIERDREAAAELLGIDLRETRRRVVSTQESQPAQRVAIGDTVESQPIPRDTDLAISLAPVARARSIAPTIRPRSRRGLVIAGTAAAAIAIGAIVIGTSGSSPTPAAAIDAASVMLPDRPAALPVPVPAPPPVPDQAMPLPIPAPVPVKPAPPKPVPNKPLPNKPAPPKPQPPPETPIDPTPQQLADLYIAVGRDLKRYSDKKGVNAEALSYRYRVIKISDALATGERRRAAAQSLKEIRAAAR